MQLLFMYICEILKNIKMKKVIKLAAIALTTISIISACKKETKTAEETPVVAPPAKTKSELISSNRWIHTYTLDSATSADRTSTYPQFIGIGNYKSDGTYAFFNLNGTAKGDVGKWSLTNNETKLKITSTSFGYTATVDIARLDGGHLDLRARQTTTANVYVQTVTAFHLATPY